MSKSETVPGNLQNELLNFLPSFLKAIFFLTFPRLSCLATLTIVSNSLRVRTFIQPDLGHCLVKIAIFTSILDDSRGICLITDVIEHCLTRQILDLRTQKECFSTRDVRFSYV